MIYDITQPLFECEVYPGDSKPEKKRVQSIEEGDICNLTDISLCVHNGTHVDAPLHFYKDGKGIDRIALEKFIGPAYVSIQEGDVTAEDAGRILASAAAAGEGACFDPGEQILRVRDHLRNAPGGFTSIYSDLKNGRKTEADFICGAVVRAAKERGIEVPVQETILHLVHAMEGR